LVPVATQKQPRLSSAAADSQLSIVIIHMTGNLASQAREIPGAGNLAMNWPNELALTYGVAHRA
jgi:hypothetical protein